MWSQLIPTSLATCSHQAYRENKFMPGTERCRIEPFAYSKGQLHLENLPPATTTPAPPLGNLPGNRQAYKT